MVCCSVVTFQGQGQGQGWCEAQSFPICTRAEDTLSVKVRFQGGGHKMAMVTFRFSVQSGFLANALLMPFAVRCLVRCETDSFRRFLCGRCLGIVPPLSTMFTRNASNRRGLRVSFGAVRTVGTHTLHSAENLADFNTRLAARSNEAKANTKRFRVPPLACHPGDAQVV